MTQNDISDDWFLTDKILLRQPKYGFRAGSDSLLLSAAVPIKDGENVLELGAGSGLVSLALANRAKNLSLHLVEHQPTMVDLAQHNLARNKASARLYPFHWQLSQGDALNKALFCEGTLFDHCICNPPFFTTQSSQTSHDLSRDQALRSDKGIEHWVRAMIRWTKPNGQLTLICRSMSLDAVIHTLINRAGGIEVLPIYAKKGENAFNVIVRAKRNRKSPLQILPPLYIRNPNGTISASMQRIQKTGDLQL